MDKQPQLQVEAIRNGSVIDHIPARIGIKLLKLFKMYEVNERITIGLNLPSSALIHKDLIKIENVFLTKEQANQLVLYAPKATVNQIEEYKVVKKLTLTLPKHINNVFKCPNSNCISHGEPIESNFHVRLKNEHVQLKCYYCEKVFSREIMTDTN
ncbi:aspartate carbamoyltransferase regulatory subunit [Candidatus Photodesmus anomalopis]|uniref:aspartate carbamoyltransferase regulatory subunit n=1 Tax=Candidatus Photodesmus anomalopis TaxID=28176 RepID=UPI00054EBCB3|nr:aspartate carbamoyltransferase regulatory subunit [Candidatus Photodesmus katoptron]